ncbi:MAG: sulfurtransferase [Congregibacter sp.]
MKQLLEVAEMERFSGVILDCRFSLTDSDFGRKSYSEGHIPGAFYLDLERDMSAPRERHGGRHPLPASTDFAGKLAAMGIDRDTTVLLYDDSRFVFAARCWWMMRALGFRTPLLLNGGYSAWLEAGGVPQLSAPSAVPYAVADVPAQWPMCCDRHQLVALQAEGACLVDAREAVRYRGEHEPIDPVAGHIPGAQNLPWQGLSGENGKLLEVSVLQSSWGELADARPLIVYCGSGVSACVNIFSLAVIGREDVWLYGGSWSDWCSHL